MRTRAFVSSLFVAAKREIDIEVTLRGVGISRPDAQEPGARARPKRLVGCLVLIRLCGRVALGLLEIVAKSPSANYNPCPGSVGGTGNLKLVVSSRSRGARIPTIVRL